MKFFGKLILLAGALGVMAPIAKAEPIVASTAMSGTPTLGATASCGGNGNCGAGGYYYTGISFQSSGLITNPNVVPNSGGVTAANSTIVPYFTMGNPVTFTAAAFPLGQAGTGSTISANPTSGGFLFASANGQTAAGIAANASLQFFITSYTITQNATNAAGNPGAVSLTGNGYFVETATGRTFTNTAATFTLNVGANGASNFSASAVTNAATTPEPSSLVLLGTGLMGAAGALFRRRSIA